MADERDPATVHKSGDCNQISPPKRAGDFGIGISEGIGYLELSEWPEVLPGTRSHLTHLGTMGRTRAHECLPWNLTKNKCAAKSSATLTVTHLSDSVTEYRVTRMRGKPVIAHRM